MPLDLALQALACNRGDTLDLADELGRVNARRQAERLDRRRD